MTRPSQLSKPIELTCPRCQHHGTYSSAAQALHFFNRHVCATVIERRDRTQRQVDLLASEGEKRDCTCKIAKHQHGTCTAYVIDRCRCHDCKVATRVYEQDRRRNAAYGRDNSRVDAEPVRAHMRALMAQGMGWKRIAATAGLSPSTVYVVLYGKGGRSNPKEKRPPRKQVTRQTADAILGVTVDLAPGVMVSSVGTSRRIQALVRVGWSQSKIGIELGIGPANIGPLAHGTRNVTKATADRVRALYDRWWDQAPPQAGQRDKIAYARAKRYSAEQGWAAPLDWDDDQIDDPDATPSLAVDDAPKNRRFHPEDVEFLAAQGMTFDGISARLGTSRNSIEKTLTRHGAGDVLERIRRNAA